MIGAVVDAGASMEIGTISTLSSVGTVIVTAVAPTLAELVWHEIRKSKIRKASPPSMISLPKTVISLRGGDGRDSVTSKRKKMTKINIRDIERKKKRSQNLPNKRLEKNDLATRGKSVAFMALGMAFHYLGKQFSQSKKVFILNLKTNSLQILFCSQLFVPNNIYYTYLYLC